MIGTCLELQPDLGVDEAATVVIEADVITFGCEPIERDLLAR